MYENALINIGLTEKQTKLYLTCLELGQSTIPKIAKASTIKRTTVYGIMDELVKLGLIKTTITGKTHIFEAQDPESLIDSLDKKKAILQKALPGLKELFTSKGTHPQMRFFHGQKGIGKIFEDVLNSGTKKVLQVVKNKELQNQGLDSYSGNYIKTRVEKGIEAFDLHPKSGGLYTKERGTSSEKYKRQVRYLPPEIFYSAMIIIYENKVAMISTQKEDFGFIMESKEFSSTMKAWFEFMWKLGSKEPNLGE